MSGRMIRGLQLIKFSLQILGQHKQLLLFPLASTVICLALIMLLIAPSWYLIGQQWLHQHTLHTKEIMIIIFILAILFLCNLVILFCNAALIAITMAYDKQDSIKLSIGFKAASACFPQIIIWTLFNTTIGVWLRLLQTRVSQLNALTPILAGTTWSVICYFVTPILVVEKKSPLQAIKRSSYLLQTTWGPSLMANFGLGTILFLARLLLLIPAMIGFYSGGFYDKIVGSAISAILLFLVAIFNSAIHNILRGVFYRYAVNKTLPPLFNPTLLDQSFRSHTK